MKRRIMSPSFPFQSRSTLMEFLEKPIFLHLGNNNNDHNNNSATPCSFYDPYTFSQVYKAQLCLTFTCVQCSEF